MESVEAFVLHARPYRESSQLVDLLTFEQGRTGVIARGSRGAKRSNPLQPFCRYRVSLGGRGDLRRVQGSEQEGAPMLLAGHALFAALYINELLVRLLYREVPVPGIFELYGQAIAGLAAAAPLEETLRRFEKQLVDELGYGHRYAETVDGEPVLATGLYTFDVGSGVRTAPPGVDAGSCYRGSALQALETGVFAGPGDLRDAKRLMRAALAPHLGNKPLNSRELFRPARIASGERGGETGD